MKQQRDYEQQVLLEVKYFERLNKDENDTYQDDTYLETYQHKGFILGSKV